MTHWIKDRVRDTTVTTGTGPITVSGVAPTRFKSFNAFAVVSDTIWIAIAHRTEDEWEISLATYTSSNVLTRTSVLSSSSGGAPVNFSAGTKDVIAVQPAAAIFPFVFTSSGIGLVPASGGGSTNFLRADGVWAAPAGGGGSTQAFGTISVSGQSDVVADAAPDTLTLVAGSNIGITTNAGTDTITFAVTGLPTVAFSTIAVSGQSDVVADTTSDTLTLVGGSNIAITTNAGTDSITFAVTGLPTVSFSTIAVSGQSDVVADTASDTLTLVAGSNIAITTTAGTDTISFAVSGLPTASFTTIAVSGQSDVVADSASDTLTLVAGTNVTITTNAGTDSITINSSGGGGGSPGGADTQVQFNDGGAFGGDADLTWNKTSNVLTNAGSEIVPLISGGTGTGSSLTLQSTTGAGTTDLIAFKTGSQVERMRINSAGLINVPDQAAAGCLVLGHTAGVSPFPTARLSIVGLDFQSSMIQQAQFANDGTGVGHFFLKSRGTSVGDMTIVQANDDVGYLTFRASGGTFFRNVAEIIVSVDGTPGASDMPGRMVFKTTPDGSTTSTERMRINNAGTVNIGKAGTSNGKLLINWDVDLNVDSFPTRFQMTATPNSDWLASFVGYGDTSAAVAQVYAKTRGATPDVHADCGASDTVGSWWFYSSNNAAWRNIARLRVLTIAGGATSNPGGWSRFEYRSTSGSLLDPLILYPDTGIGAIMVGGDGSNPNWPARTLQARFQDSATNTSVPVLRLSRDTLGSAAAGIGAGIEFDIDTGAFTGGATGNWTLGGILDVIATDVTGSSEDFDFRVNLMTAGAAAAEKFRVVSDGTIKVNSVTHTASDAGFDVVYGWDDSASTYKSLLLADIATEASPASGDFVLIYGAEGDLRKANWSTLPGGGGGAQTPWASDIDTADFDLITAGEALTIKEDDASTDTVRPILNLRRTSSGGAGANGIGASLTFEVECAATVEIGASIEAVTTDVTDTSEDFDLVFKLMTAGAAAAQVFKVASTGVVTLKNTNMQLDPSADSNNFVFRMNAASFSYDVNGALNGASSIRFGTGDWSSVGDLNLSRNATGQARLEGVTSQTNAVSNMLRLRHSTSGTAANGIGLSIEFEQDTGSDNYEIGASISAVTTDVTSTSEDFDLVFSTMAAGAAAAERMRINNAAWLPGTDDAIQLGSTSLRFADLFLAEGAVINFDNGDMTLTQVGNALTVAGGVLVVTGLRENEVNLTDAATVSLDSSLGNTFKLVAAGNRTIDVPSNKPASGLVQKIVIMHEASGADRTLSLTTGSAGSFRFGTDITGLTATTSGLVDYIGCIYNDADDRWDVVSYTKGF